VKIILDKDNVTGLKTWFSGYVQNFKYDDPALQENIDLKERHTKRVCKEILNIGRHLGLNEEELNLAETVGLLHDVGRFEQYDRYRTFSDRLSEDHAELGIRVLDKEGILDNLDPFTKELITCTIRSHNKSTLPANQSDTCLFFTRILRDADKLDIWRLIIDHYYKKNGKTNGTVTLDLPDTPGFSEEVYNDLLNRRIVNLKHVKNLNDFKLLQMGWIYDVNFKPTSDYIKKYRYMEKLRDVLPESEQINYIFEKIIAYRDSELV
jgi:putative nucleotidyltransferase with HDIG domain